MVQLFLNKASFNFHVYMTYGQAQENKPWRNIHYLHAFINSISRLHLPTLNSQAAVISSNYTFYFPLEKKSYATKFDLVVKMVKVNWGLSFEKTMISRSP